MNELTGNLFKADLAIKSKKIKAGKIAPVMGWQEDFQFTNSGKGIKEYVPGIPDRALREVETKNDIISAIINARCDQIRPYSKVSKYNYTPGFRVVMQDEEKKPTKAELQEIKEIEKWILNTGRTDFDSWDERDDSFYDVLNMQTRDILSIDKYAIELRYDLKGSVVDFHYLDPATIKRVIWGGYRGNKKDFDSRSILFGDQLLEKLSDQKLSNIPELKDISYVQIIDGVLVGGFTKYNLIFNNMQKRSDIRYRGFGYSKIEQCLISVTSYLYAQAYNTEAFKKGAIPKFALALEEGGFDEESLQELAQEWNANFRGVYGAWHIPVLNGKASVLDLYKSPRDMEYSSFLQWVGGLICAVFGIDPQEIGLRFNQAQNVLNENQDGKMQFSKDRGLRNILATLEDCYNKILRLAGWSDKYRFAFTGVTPFDAEQEVKLEQQKVKTYMTVNELRAEKDMKAVEGGDVILDAIFMQSKQADAMASQEQDREESDIDDNSIDDENIDDDENLNEDDVDMEDDFDVDSAIDEALSKSKILKARTQIF